MLKNINIQNSYINQYIYNMFYNIIKTRLDKYIKYPSYVTNKNNDE